MVKERTRVCGLHFPPSAFKEEADEGNFFVVVEGPCGAFFFFTQSRPQSQQGVGWSGGGARYTLPSFPHVRLISKSS